MNARSRLAVSIFLIGLALITAAQLTPGFVSRNSTPTGSTFPATYFLFPTRISISISELNGSAQLLVAPLYSSQHTGPPVVNTTVTYGDSVIFSIGSRGYYSVEFEPETGSPTTVTYTVVEGGVPSDLEFFGAAIVILGIALAIAWTMEQRLRDAWHRT